MEIGDFLKEVREDNKLTQAQAAVKMGVSRRTYINYETGESSIKFTDLLRFVRKCKYRGAIDKLKGSIDLFGFKDKATEGHPRTCLLL